MAKPQLTLSELTKSLKSQTSGMDEQQLKRANETLEKLAAVSGEDKTKIDEIQKGNSQIKKSLGKDGDINKSLQDMLKFYKTSNKDILKHNQQLLKKFDDLQKPKDRTRLGDIKYEKPLTFREGLKENIAGAKNFFSKVGGVGSGILNTIKNPGQAINKVIGKAQDNFYGGFESAKDILSTDKNYTAEAGRFGETYAKTDEGKKFGDKAQKMGEVAFNQLKAKEKEIADVESKIKEMKRQGFDPNKGDVDQLQLLKQQRSDLDIRNPSQINAAISPALKAEEKSQYAKVDSNQTPGFLKPLGNIGDKNEAGKNINAQALNANNAAEASAISKEESFLKQNPEGDNIQSANEKMADSLKELSLTSKDILIATRESVDILKSINKDLLGDNVQPLRTKEQGVGGVAPAEAAAAGSPGLLETGMDLAGDLLGRDKGKPGKGFPRGKGPTIPGKAGLGSRIIDGAKGIGSKLGGLARGAGSLLSKAAVPLAIAGAGYSAYQGVGRTGENFDLKEGEEATLGQKTSSALGSVASDFSFGIVDEKSAAQGIHKAGSAVKDFFTGGDKDIKAGTGASGFPLQSETKPAETAAGQKVEFMRARSIREQTGGYAIKGHEGGYNLNGKKEDVEAAVAAYNEFDELAKNIVPGEPIPDDVATKMMAAGNKFKSLAQKINSPEYKAKMKEISDIQNNVKEQKKQEKDVTAKMDDSQIGAMQPAAAEGKLSSDPQLDQDIKAQRKRAAEVTPSRPSTKSGDLSNSSLEYTDLDRARAQSQPTPAPVIMNNSSNSATTKIMPMKGDPRPSSRGSPLDRYLDRTSSFSSAP